MEDPSEEEQVDDFDIRTERKDSGSRIDVKTQRDEKLRRMMDDDGN